MLEIDRHWTWSPSGLIKVKVVLCGMEKHISRADNNVTVPLSILKVFYKLLFKGLSINHFRGCLGKIKQFLNYHVISFSKHSKINIVLGCHLFASTGEPCPKDSRDVDWISSHRNVVSIFMKDKDG